MESLYVCLFSNGHIKVGRSIDPISRIATHVDRVSCMGITLDRHEHFPCLGSASRAEAALIARCNENAQRRHKSEWFVGLEFQDVMGWAQQLAAQPDPSPRELPALDLDRPDFAAILVHLKFAGHTQMEIASYCGCAQPSISDISTGRTKDPSYSVGSALVRMVRSLQEEAA